MLLVAALEEANVRYAWSSGIIIGCLASSGVLLVAFLGWEWILSSRKHVRMEPMLPWRLFRSRVVLGIIMLVEASPLRPARVFRVVLASRRHENLTFPQWLLPDRACNHYTIHRAPPKIPDRQ